ncbi:MAG: hypothetical protein EP346_14035 [Bacteroidetes bacterium]|nr:MAG: hypothetical protein EP346_14035 [Bacteroidota bacterium]
MAKIIHLLSFLFLGTTAMAQAQMDPDSVMTVVLNALTTEEHTAHGNIDSLLAAGSWEALAYWDMTTPKTVESLQEAVGDRYSFGESEFQIDLIDPNNPRQVGISVKGQYRRSDYTLSLFTEANGPKQQLDIWYIDEKYLVIELDKLRIFLTHEKSYYLLD